jgi:hypothetical protein
MALQNGHVFAGRHNGVNILFRTPAFAGERGSSYTIVMAYGILAKINLNTIGF